MTSRAPERLALPDRPPPADLVRRVGVLLEEGAVVALPTETVYGLAARADSAAALERLRGIKGSATARGWTWHVGSRAALGSFEHLRPLALRLAERYWPGPLTLVLEGVPEGLAGIAHEGWTGARMPAHEGTAGLLEGLGFPVVMTSANRAGGPPATDAAGVQAAFPTGLALVLDGGEARLGEPSGVLRLGRGCFRLEREGLLGIGDLRRTAGLSILFVCTGNTCRSPMAGAMAAALLRERLRAPAGDLASFGFRVDSAGIFAAPGSPASPHAVEAMEARGIALGGHLSRPADEELLAQADRVYALTRSHLEALLGRASGELASKLFLLHPSGEDVPDPIGGTRQDYEACAARIEAALLERLAEWA